MSQKSNILLKLKKKSLKGSYSNFHLFQKWNWLQIWIDLHFHPGPHSPLVTISHHTYTTHFLFRYPGENGWCERNQKQKQLCMKDLLSSSILWNCNFVSLFVVKQNFQESRGIDFHLNRPRSLRFLLLGGHR